MFIYVFGAVTCVVYG